MMNKNKKLNVILISIIALFIISMILTYSSQLDYKESLRIVFGSIYVLFLPGFILTFIFFPSNIENSIDIIERIALSFALSIAIVPLAVFYLNLIGIKINLLNTFLTILGIIIISLIILYLKNKKTNNKI